MNPLARSLLRCFDGLGRDSLDLAEMGLRVGIAPDGNVLRSTVEELVRGGFLRTGGAPDRFVRTEDGRLALAGPREVTLYTRPGCHLCEEAKFAMAPLLREFGARLSEVNIDLDPTLHARFTNDVPVIFLGSRKVAKHRLDLRQFRRQLESAAPR